MDSSNTSRDARLHEIERVMVEHLCTRGTDWATATELALEVGYPWRAVARALMRLAGDGLIEQQAHEWQSNRQRMRQCFVYRHIVTAHAEFPSWLMPRGVPTHQMVAAVIVKPGRPRSSWPKVKRVRK